MEKQFTEEDIQWLAKVIAMIPALPIPSDTITRLQAQEFINEIHGRWQATDKGILAVINWKSVE